MRAIQIIFLLLAFSFTCLSQPAPNGPDLVDLLWQNQNASNNPFAGFLVHETFEGTTTPPTNWAAQILGTPNFHSTTSPLADSKSWQVTNGVAGTVSTVSNFSQSEVYGEFLYRASAFSNSYFAALRDPTAVTAKMFLFINSSNLTVSDASITHSNSTTVTMLPGNTNYIFYHYRASTTSASSNGLMETWFSLSPTNPGVGSNYASVTNSSQTNVVGAFNISCFVSGATYTMDNVFIATNAFWPTNPAVSCTANPTYFGGPQTTGYTASSGITSQHLRVLTPVTVCGADVYIVSGSSHVEFWTGPDGTGTKIGSNSDTVTGVGYPTQISHVCFAGNTDN